MSRRSRIAWIAAASFVGLTLALVLAFIIVVQTSWFRNAVERQIVSSVEKATGGQAQVGGFSFHWQNLRATVHNFTIHGSEPAGSPPLFQAKTVEVGLSPVSPLSGFVNIASLMVDSPQIHLIVYPDGHTNVPAPKPGSGKTNVLETIVNLAVGRFEVRNGTFTVADRRTNFSAQGENLRAHLDYNRVNPGYTGEIDAAPLFLQRDNGAPVRADVHLPLTLRRDLVAVDNGQVRTAASHLTINGRLDHMTAPDGRAHIVGTVNLGELKRAAGLHIPLQTAKAPQAVEANVTLVIRKGAIGFQNSRLVLGNSTVDLSGMLNEGREPAGFRAKLDLTQLGTLFAIGAQPRGVVNVTGDFALRPGGYVLHAAAAGSSLSLLQGKTRVTGIDVAANATAVPNHIELADLRIGALGGDLTGSATVENQQRFQLTGTLHHLDIDRVARTFTPEHIGYDGLVSGPVILRGELGRLAELEARANLSVAPVPRGIPLSGRLNASYAGRTGTVTIAPSRLDLPHSRLELSGSLGTQLQVRLISRDLSDFRPLVIPPVTLNSGGTLTTDAIVKGSLAAPRISGQATMTDFTVDQRPFARFTTGFDATRSGASVTNAVVSRGNLSAHFNAAVGLHNWKPLPTDTLRADAAVRNADLADALALIGQGSIPASGTLTADANISGTVGSPVGNVNLAVSNGTLRGARFDAINGRAILTDRSIDVPSLEYVAGASRIQASGTYQHTPNQLSQGTVRAELRSNQVQLAQFQPMVKGLSGLSGVLNLQADATGIVQPAAGGAAFRLTGLRGSLAARGVTVQGRSAGDLTATADTAGSAVTYDVTSNLGGSAIKVTGSTMLTGDNATVATANISHLSIPTALALAGMSDLPVKGTLSATGRVSGTFAAPQVTASVDVTNGSAWQEPFSRLQSTFQYSNQTIQVTSARIDKDGSHIEAAGSFSHAPGDFRDGRLEFHLQSNQVQLAQLQALQQTRKVGGTAEVTASGAATLQAGKAPFFSSLNASLAARGLTVNGVPMGDLTAGAETHGSQAAFTLTSSLAGSKVQGSGTVQLTSDLTTDARLSFSGLTYSGLRPLLGTPAEPLEASADGQLVISGPLARPEALRGTLEISQLKARSASNRPAGMQPRVDFEAHNDGPIRVMLANSLFTIENFRLAGPYSSLTVTGTVSLATPHTLALRAGGNIKLELLQAFDPDLFSSGNIILTATAAGTLSEPVVNGKLELQKASLNMVSLPNGLSDASGTITFTGREAVIQNITGRSGGGDITLSGTVGYAGPEPAVRLQITGNRIHVNYPENVTTAISARLTLTGTASRSLLSGTVTIRDVALHSQTDIGSILNSAAAPKPVTTTPTGFLAGMRFDVKIRTAPDTQFRTSLTQNLQADANLTLRGTPDQPGMLGRIVITEGQVVFFGNKYRIEQGAVAFYDPQKINPYVDIDLDTTVSGVDVTISVTGPMDRLKLTYRSDPPLPFSDLLSLLASGRVNTTDPVIAARQPAVQQQSFEQAGASALLGQAVANPVSGTLERLFGVTRLQINPQIVGANSTSPQATLTVQQQITPDLTFTYMQDVAQSNPQIIKVEWTIGPEWSAVAQRDYTGFFYLDFFYKKRFW